MKRDIVVPVALLLLIGLPAAAQQDRTRSPVIDMHLHAHHVPLPLQPGAPPPCLPRPCVPEGEATATSEESLRKTLEQMDRYNIVKGYLSSAELDLVYEWAAAAPDRFIAAPFIVEPGELSIEMLRQEYQQGRLAGMGEIGSQLVGIPPNDPRLAPYFALAAEFGVPVLIHTEGIGPPLPGFRTAAGSPLLLEDVLARHRDLKVFVENTGYPFLDEMTAMMYQYPNLYGDLSTITWVIPRPAFHRYLEALIGAGLGKRLMFGSDQMRWPEKIGNAIEAIEEADYLTEEQKRDILYNNAARFLGLSEEEIARHHGQ
jgi:predicted TIM-barrel fold metal-dependent hydrolase